MDESTVGKKTSGLTRREFLTLSGGLIVTFSLTRFAFGAEGDQAEDEGTDLNAWLHVGADNHVTVFSGKVDMGQGTTTAFALLAAEELTLPVSAIEMVMGETDRVPYDDGTWGSESMRSVGAQIRAAAAAAREILAELAAQRWGVAREAVVVKGGRISLLSDPRKSMTLGEATGGKHFERKLKGEPKFLPLEQHQLLNKRTPQLMSRDLVTGAQRFVGDLRLPNMLYGGQCYPSCLNAKLTRVDAAAAEKAPGVVKVVVEGDFIGVAGVSPEAVAEGMARLQPVWEEPTHPVQAKLWEDFRAQAGKPEAAAEDGAVVEALAKGARTFEATYRAPYVAHAPIEPHVALVHVQGKEATIYAAAQTPFAHRDEVAKLLGFAPKQVHVQVPRVGGAFGGKAETDVAQVAARLSRATGRPVLVAQTRAQEFTWNYFKPAALIDLRSALDASGKIVAWDCDIYNCGDRGAVPPYDLPNRRVRCFYPDSHLRQGAWRGLAGIYTTFAIESHMDELARATGQDPVAFRLRHAEGDARLAKTIKAVAEAYGWPAKEKRAGLGVGFACAPDAGSYAAEIAEVAVNRETGALQVQRACIAHESGLVVNVDGITNQIEGGFVMGLGPTLREEIRYDKGRILTTDFQSYRLPTMHDTPEFTTVLVPNPTLSPQGAGEPALFPVAAVVANAICDATGPRIRELPLTPARVMGKAES
jgi:isoquinoline 1-oxidoreductase